MITICGLGSLGGHLVEHLARQGCRELRLVDHDKVEPHNLANQPYFGEQQGRTKVNAMAETLFRVAGLRPETHCKTLNAGSTARLLQGSELVLDCLDNSDGRRAVQAACRKLGIACLHVGMFADYCEAVWDEAYAVPESSAPKPCAEQMGRVLALLATVLFDRAWRTWKQSGARENYACTLGDLHVSRW